jgi:hypothetical protein
MVDRDPFRFPTYNPLLSNFLTEQLQQPSGTGQPIIPSTGAVPTATGPAQTPTPGSQSYAYNMHRAMEAQLMARFLQNAIPAEDPAGGLQPETEDALRSLGIDPATLTQDSAPLAGEPGLQFDDSHMTLDPNQLAEQLGLDLGPAETEPTDPSTDTGQPLDVDPDRIEELGAELRLRVDGNEINDDDLDRIAGLSSEERVATLQQLDPEQLKALGDQLPDQDSSKAGNFLAALAQDAEAHPEVQDQFGAILEGIQQDGSERSDDVLHRMQETLGGGDVSDEANATRAAETLQHLGPDNLARMAELHSSGNKDEKELGVIGRARGLAAGQTPEAAGLTADLTQRLAEDDVDGELIDRINGASPEDRLSVLEGLSQEEREKLAFHGTDDDDQMGALMASLVQDAETDPRAAQIVGDLTNGLNDSHTSRDNVLQRMQEILGGGDVESSDARRQAARALSVLDPATLDRMAEAHNAGNKDDKELDVIELARELQQGEPIL